MIPHLRHFVPLAIAASLCTSARGEFGLTEDRHVLTIDCESRPGLVVKVRKSDGSLRSIVVNGSEMQKHPRGSHINSGLGDSAEVKVLRNDENRILISVERDPVLHYYAFRKGRPNVYMATWADTCPHPGEMRFIARLDAKQLGRGNLDRPADTAAHKAIESKDIFIQPDGRTTSKYYSSVRHIEDRIHGSRGRNVGAYFAIGSYESSSGGPFFRDINTQTAGPTEEVYFYMFSGHAQTEPFRRGQLHGPYALCFTSGPPPRMPAMGWMADLGLKDWVAERGRVNGSAKGMLPGLTYVVWLSNDTAQYWTKVGRDGRFKTRLMKPGTYTARLMRGELEVATADVKVGTDTATVDFEDPGLADYLWLMGMPDGTPRGFRNAERFDQMHPSDKRNQPWGPLTYTVRGRFPKDLTGFPGVQWMGVNNGNRILFDLKPDETREKILEIRTTVSHSGGRPMIEVNDSWKSRLPKAPRFYDSRSITFGTWRGFNHTHEIRIPAKALRPGRNTIRISIVSGSRSGAPFLSPAVVYDSIGLRDAGQ